MADVTKGAEALLATPPVVSVGDKKYPMRRLGLRDITTWLKMIRDSGSRGVKGVYDLLGDLKLPDEQVGIAAFVYGLVDLVDDVTGWLASLLGVKADVLNDPAKFPLDSFIDIIEALSDHPDLAAFLAKLRALSGDPQRMGKITKLFGNKQSTDSNPVTDGATTKPS